MCVCALCVCAVCVRGVVRVHVAVECRPVPSLRLWHYPPTTHARLRSQALAKEVNARVSALAESAIRSVEQPAELQAGVDDAESLEDRTFAEVDAIRGVIDVKEARIRGLLSSVHRLEFDVQAAKTDAERFAHQWRIPPVRVCLVALAAGRVAVA